MTVDPEAADLIAQHIKVTVEVEKLRAEVDGLRISVDAIRREAFEEAAKICEAQQLVFLSPKYSINQPTSSFAERFAAGVCAREIRKAGGIPDPHES